MLLRGSNSRGTRGAPPNRSRGSSRGRGSTSRGALNSSGTSPTESSPDTFEAERFENAAKREQRGASSAAVNGRGGGENSRGPFSNKQVRFANPLIAETKEGTSSRPPSPAPPNPFSSATTSIPFGTPSTMSSNPFAPQQTEPLKNPFSQPTSSPNLFGVPSQPSQSSSTTISFGKVSAPPAAASNQEQAHNPSIFGAPSNPFSTALHGNGISNSAFPKPLSSTPPINPFGAISSTDPSLFSADPVGPSSFGFSSSGQSNTAATSRPSSNPFANNTPGALPGPSPKIFPTAPSSSALTFGSPLSVPTISQPSNLPKSSPFGAPPPLGALANVSPKPSAKTNNSTTFGANPNNNGFRFIASTATKSNSTALKPPARSDTSRTLTETTDKLLRQQNILPPEWPTSNPGDPKEKDTIHAFWQTYKGYRAKVRASLIRAGLLDDPDKPKKLSEAIDFKGTCEEMCPEFEKITRIVEHDVQIPEKDLASDGTLWPAPQKMIKALARSAAGQDAPLPMDVRSPAALRRTFDYLLHTVLGEDGDLSAVHGFLWDRTRAIRRDFVFQSSMSKSEVLDQVYCLERITRFHVIALHQMSREIVIAEDFSEQQEIEQLGKALLSLIHAYEDCQAQGIACDNEAEFRAYYVLFNCHNSGILEIVQDWGWKFWGESDQVKIAVSLVETLQNIWDPRGPLKPHAATDIAQNSYSRFFSILEDKKVTYTMACFAEIHFNGVRKSALKTILASYRKQRDQTKDWTLTKLNDYLRFDDEEEIIEFGEAYGLQFQESDGEVYLSIDSEEPSDPFPPLKQRYSYSLVERKRGDYSLPIVIDATMYDVGEGIRDRATEEESLFVKDNGAGSKARSETFSASSATAPQNHFGQTSSEKSASTQTFQGQSNSNVQTPASIFIQSTPPIISHDFFSPNPATTSPPHQAGLQKSSIFTKPPPQELAPKSASTLQTEKIPIPPFPFLDSRMKQPASGSSEPLQSLEQNIVAAGDTPIESPKLLFQRAVTATAPVASPKSILSSEQHSVAANFPTPSTMPRLPVGEGSITSPPQPPDGVAQNPSVSSFNPSYESSLPQSSPGTGSLFTPAPESTFSITPNRPGPQPSLSPTRSLPDKGAGRMVSLSSSAQLSASNKREARFDNFVRWVFVGDGGILDNFIEHHVENILRDTVGIYSKEQSDKRAKEEEEQAREKADHFRYRSLSTKYGHRWREAARRIWMRRTGRQARKARQEMAESLRASKALQSANVVEDFRASASSSRRGSLESLLNATGALTGVHDPESEVRATVQRKQLKTVSTQGKSARSTKSPASSISGHKRVKSSELFRRSLLSDPTFLHGGSRIHLMSKYDARDDIRRQVSGVQTDYFRLKARGINTLANGSPLASSVTKDLLHQKRSLDGIIKPATPTMSLMAPPVAGSLPAKPFEQSEVVWKGTDSSEVIQAMKARAKVLIGEESPHKKRNFDDDNELFARAKRVREQMDEGSEWYHKQIERDTESRSLS